MDYFIGAHSYSLPTQGNVYCSTNLSLKSGKKRTLVATLKRKVYSFEFSEENGFLCPYVKEVPFTYIPSGAEIISIDAFNRSLTTDDFFVGITIIKVNGEQTPETYLNVYTEQEIDESSELNLDCLAQNCLMLELPFIPYHLYNTIISGPIKSREVVWLLSGGDLKVHLFREDPTNHTYCETEADDLFPEFLGLPSVVLWMDIKFTPDLLRRLTAYGCECGTLKFFSIDLSTNSVMMDLSKLFDAPICTVLLFDFKRPNPFLAEKYLGKITNTTEENKESDKNINLLVINTLQLSVVFMNVIEEEFNHPMSLPDSDKFDSALCACVADINMDGIPEIIIGTYSKVLLFYVYENGLWLLKGQQKLPHAVHAIMHVDLTDDGAKELLVSTLLGVTIFQPKLQVALEKFKDKMSCLGGLMIES